MEQNVGRTDKIIRLALGIISVYLGFAYSRWFWILAAILLITAATGFCGLYKLLKIDTR